MTEQQIGVPKNWQTHINQLLEASSYLERHYEDDDSAITFKTSELSPVLFATFPPIADFRLFVDIKIEDRSGAQKEFKKVYLGGIINDSDSRSNHPLGERYFEYVKRRLEEIIHRSYHEAKAESLDEARNIGRLVRLGGIR
ncbi:hypothetical protein HY450_03405 [Candidatus Pacearchaeota archaeon]|nr:hypothetical protein [Candidatus Pacearchaeota archaeon]